MSTLFVFSLVQLCFSGLQLLTVQPLAHRSRLASVEATRPNQNNKAVGQTANEVELCKRHRTPTDTLSHCFHVVTRHGSLMILVCLPTLRIHGKLTLLSVDFLPCWIGPNCIYGLDHWFKISGNCTF